MAVPLQGSHETSEHGKSMSEKDKKIRIIVASFCSRFRALPDPYLAQDNLGNNYKTQVSCFGSEHEILHSFIMYPKVCSKSD